LKYSRNRLSLINVATDIKIDSSQGSVEFSKLTQEVSNCLYLKITSFWDVKPFSPPTFFRNGGGLVLDYTALYPRPVLPKLFSTATQFLERQSIATHILDKKIVLKRRNICIFY
jgi:hypothetical protein